MRLKWSKQKQLQGTVTIVLQSLGLSKGTVKRSLLWYCASDKPQQYCG